MPNVTLSVNEETRKKMKQHPEIRWSNAIRVMIDKKLDDFKEAERLAQKSTLTEKDVEILTEKVNRDAAKHAKRLMNESNS
ncbi:MAG: hypothetical protein ABID38_02355 [Candidatus Diapherotrites archaeon]